MGNKKDENQIQIEEMMIKEPETKSEEVKDENEKVKNIVKKAKEDLPIIP